ncbi:MAG TPA: hypothetical protein ENK06_14220 [Gammaproteobacteria bacterium]|nr:hypothetical protein [Gammaproteobacteria bacterium]
MTILHRLIILLFLLMPGCASQTVLQKENSQAGQVAPITKPANAGYLLRFVETRPEAAERRIRMIITDQYLRIDEGRQAKDFVLFNRKNKTLAHVDNNKVSVSQFDSAAEKIKPNFPLNWFVASQTSHALMKTQEDGKAKAMHYRLYLNDKPCYNLVSIESHLTETLDTLREYNQLLANQRKQVYKAVEGQQCRDAIKIFSPDIRLQYGFPLREWGSDGYQRFLVDVKKDIIFPATMFQLPDS